MYPYLLNPPPPIINENTNSKTFSVKGSRFKSKFRIQWNNDLAVKFPIEKKPNQRRILIKGI